MDAGLARSLVAYEAGALMARLRRVEPFALNVPMVPAASPSPEALRAIDAHLTRGRLQLGAMIRSFCRWLASPEGRAASPSRIQGRFTFLRLRFNAVLTDLDVFSDALSQRAEHRLGVRLAGIDALAADALALPGRATPEVLCYLDQGLGAAIRRARTRLPAGGDNPVAVVRVPRERMVGSAIGSSVVHEVGHQAAALLGLVESLRPTLRAVQAGSGPLAGAWEAYERWISEIVPDAWAVARLSLAAPFGLMAVVSLPRVFVFRANEADPHPTPWVRVLLSCALGEALYPDPAWSRISAAWRALYPAANLDAAASRRVWALRRTLPAFVRLLLEHRPPALRGGSLRELLADPLRAPSVLRAQPLELSNLEELAPSHALAVLGQARADGRLAPVDEGRAVDALLQRWALGRTVAPPVLRRTRLARRRPQAVSYR